MVDSRIGHTGRLSRRGPGSSKEKGRARLSLPTREKLLGALLFVPAGLLLAVIVAYPLVYGVRLGFFSVDGFSQKVRLVGLDNFVRTLTSGEFFRALWIGIQWAVGSLVLQLVLGIAVSLLLNQQFYGRSAVRSLAIFPYLVPVVVAVMVWRWLFNDVYGFINYLLTATGITDGPVLWLSKPGWALLAVILVGTWRVFPFVVIVVLARLQTIPQQLYDAAKTDGASSWRLFWDITLPQLRSVLLVTVFLRFIWDFNDFNVIALTTGGGPVGSTQTLPILIYEQAFSQQQLGLAAATADLALVALGAFFVLYFLAMRRQEDE